MEILITLAKEAETPFFQQFVGVAGNVLALFFFLSPIIVMYKLITKKIEAKDIPYLMLIANIMNCLLWFIYGWYKEDPTIYICNGVGGTLNIVYLLIYWLYFVDKNIGKYIGMFFGTIAILGGIFCGFFFGVSKEADNEITGYVAMIFNIIMYAAPGQKLIEVYQTGRHELIPIVNSAVGFLCSSCWLTYGIYIANIQVIVPNALGVFFSLIQIGFWFFFWNKSKNTPSLDYVEHGETKADNSAPKTV